MKALKRILKKGGVITAQVEARIKNQNKLIIGVGFWKKALEMLSYPVLIFLVLTVNGILIHL